jgi:hypothetical protein
MPKYPTEKSVGEKHGTNQDIEDGEDGNQDPDSAAQKVTRDEDGEIIEVEDEGDLFDEIGSKKGYDKDDGYKDFFKMFHDVLLDLFHDLSLFHFLPKGMKRFRANERPSFT